MASTNKTPQLGLNQWAAGDSVLRADFNADNLKIEAGMEAAQMMVKLADITTTAPSAQVDLDVSTLDWSKYIEVIIYANIKCTELLNASMGCLRINGYAGSSDYAYLSGGSSYDSSYCVSCTFETPGNVGRNRLSIVSLDKGCTILSENGWQRLCGRSSGFCKLAPNLTDLRTLNFVPQTAGVTLRAGSRILIYGIKK